MPPETAHRLTLTALAAGLGGTSRTPDLPELHQRVCGLDFPNPLGMAAGYDKNAEVPDALLGLGLGFAEVGSVTPADEGWGGRFITIEDTDKYRFFFVTWSDGASAGKSFVSS